MLSFSLNTFQRRCSSQSQENRGYKEFCNMKLVHHPLEKNKKQIVSIYLAKYYFLNIKTMTGHQICQEVSRYLLIK